MKTTRKKDGVEAEAYFREGGCETRDAGACVCYGQAKHEANLISSGSKNTLLGMNCNGDFYPFLPLLNTPLKLRLGCDGSKNAFRNKLIIQCELYFLFLSPRTENLVFCGGLSLIPLLSHYDRQIESVFLPRVFRRGLSPKRMNLYILSLSLSLDLARSRGVGSQFAVVSSCE